MTEEVADLPMEPCECTFFVCELEKYIILKQPRELSQH